MDMAPKMKTYKIPDEHEVERINKTQKDLFNKTVDLFDPPLQKGVPERLEQIVAAAEISKGDWVLDIGTGTGILVPLIRKYEPGKIFACDLVEAMLARLKEHYPYAETLLGDARDLTLPDESIDVVFMNAVYPNIVDKGAVFNNMSRTLKTGGRMVISHPMGKSFIDKLRKGAPFPLDDFPEEPEAETLLAPYGLEITIFVDEPELYILVAVKT
ncbi:2-methoxy-6-polyprenyl-1,4-benzoquinol methylase [subsurface metagenome]